MSTRPKFIANIQINELLNIPLVTGRCWVKWYVRDSAKPDARGHTVHVPVRDHKAQWDEPVKLRLRLGIQSKTKLLKEYVVIFDVMWDQNGTDKLTLGRVEINLAEFVNNKTSSSNEVGKKTKYLLKNSKINGALALTIAVAQVSGPTDYVVPQATSSAVFGDITGVLKETKDSNGTSGTDILNELHYKQFAVSWNKHDYELDPKSCIEDIFLGGTGFKKSDQGATARHGSGDSGAVVSNSKDSQVSQSAVTLRSSDSVERGSGDRSNNLPPYLTGFGDDVRPLNPNARLLSEEEEREDLRSWKLREVY